MRLICPNCDAQYEVPDEVMPTSGRDVQCSNCGQTWFQHHPDHLPEEETEVAEVTQPAPAPAASQAARPATTIPSTATTPDQPPPATARKQLDPSVTDILRQEAEAEQEARRRRQAETLESQPELGLEGANDPSDDERAQRAKARTSRIRGEEQRSAAETTATAAAVGTRRELLPDIEEINSSLRAGKDRRTHDASGQLKSDKPVQEPKGRSGFRSGFLIVVMLAVLTAVLYSTAPQIAEAVPALKPYLATFTAQIDVARAWLNDALRAALQWLDAKAVQSGD